jgi:predicted nucleotidyltransferase component of viral defense system
VRDRPTHGTTAGSRYLALRTLARQMGRPTAEILQLYALEGVLARVARSPYRDALVLKGGMLLAAFDLRRTTRDVDFLALRTDNDEAVVRELVRAVAGVEIDDGLVFAIDAIHSDTIRDEDLYPGVRVRLEATLATARLALHVDVNVGDPVVPAPVHMLIPSLPCGPTVEMLAYPKAMVIAEKLVTAMQRGTANTRWRDFADLHLLLLAQDVEASDLVLALRGVASHRQVPLSLLSHTLRGMPDIAEARWRVWWQQQDLEGRVPESLAELLQLLSGAADGFIRAANGEPPSTGR